MVVECEIEIGLDALFLTAGRCKSISEKQERLWA
jgi:hypothetical protein